MPDPSQGATLEVRLEAESDGRVHVTELRLRGEIGTDTLRAIPLGRIEAAANALVTAFDVVEMAGAVHERKRGGSRSDPAPDMWETVSASAPVERPTRRRPRSLVVDTGDEAASGRGRSDAFYAQVAALYRDLSLDSSRPAALIAEANEVPVTTAHRWIKEARRRGHLPPGRAGKTG